MEWGEKKILGDEGSGEASQAGRAQRVIGFTGTSPVQFLAFCANRVKLDLEECARTSELTDDACSRLSTRPPLCRRRSENWPRTTAFSFLSKGLAGGGGLDRKPNSFLPLCCVTQPWNDGIRWRMVHNSSPRLHTGCYSLHFPP